MRKRHSKGTIKTPSVKYRKAVILPKAKSFNSVHVIESAKRGVLRKQKKVPRLKILKIIREEKPVFLKVRTSKPIFQYKKKVFNPNWNMFKKLNIFQFGFSFFANIFSKTRALKLLNVWPNTFKGVFDPVRLVGALFAFVFVISFLGIDLISWPKINQAAVIKDTVIKQTSLAVAGQPVSYSLLLKRSAINDGAYLVRLPKGSSNIRVKTISAQDAKGILEKRPGQAASSLTLEQKQQMAQAIEKTPSQGNIFSGADKLLFANIDPILRQFTRAFQKGLTRQIQKRLFSVAEVRAQGQAEAPSEPITPEIIETKDASFVDVSSQADLPPASAGEAQAGISSEAAPTDTTTLSDSQPDSQKSNSQVTQTPDSKETSAANETEIEPEAEMETETEVLLEDIKENPSNQISQGQEESSMSSSQTSLTPSLPEDFTESPSSGGSANVEISDPAPASAQASTGANLPANDTQAGALADKSAGKQESAGQSESVEATQTPTIGETSENETAGESAKEEIIEEVISAVDRTESASGETKSAQISASDKSSAEQAGEPKEEKAASEEEIIEEEEEFVEIEFEIPAPKITEQDTAKGKEVTISAPDVAVSQEAEPIHLTDVLAFTTIPELFDVGQEDKIQIKWRNENNQVMPFTAHDTNENGKLDYVEWTVPHLSDQTFDIIFISKAFRLDENREIVEDIYDKVSFQDNEYANISDGQYVRATFDESFTSQNNITLYAKANCTTLGLVQLCGATIEVYPVYPDGSKGDELIATFENIDEERFYKVPLDNLAKPTDVFDLKIIGDVAINYIVYSDINYGPNKILTPTGYKNLSELAIGDEVVGYENGNQVINHIEGVEFIKPEKYNYWAKDENGNTTNYVEVPFTYYLINETWELFKDQSIWVNDRVVHASELQIGDTIYDTTHQEIKINSIRSGEDHIQWMRFTVSGNHSYVADGLLLHNASRYWVGGGSSTDWSATASTNWSATSGGANNASVPGAADDVFFDGVGGGASDSSIDTTITVNSLDMTGYANTLTMADGRVLTIDSTTFKLSSSMTYTLGGPNISVSFTSTSGTTLITTNGKTMPAIEVNGAGGTFQLQDHLTSSGTISFWNGTFDANNKNVTASILTFGQFGTVATVTMGTGTWTVTGNNTTIVTVRDSTELTLNKGNAIVLNYSGSTGTRTIDIREGNNASVTPSFNVTAGSDTIAISGLVPGVDNLDFTGFSGTWGHVAGGNFVLGSLTISTGMSITGGTGPQTFAATSGTKTITSNGKTIGRPVTFDGVGGTWQLSDALTVSATGGTARALTLTNGTFNANNFDVSAGSFSSSNTNTRTLTMGTGTWTLASTGTVWTTATNTGLTFSGSSATIKLTNTSATARTITAGSLAGMPSIWISAGTSATTFTNVTNCVDLNFTGFTGTGPAFPATINGSLTLVSGMTMPAASATTITFAATSTGKTITSGGQTIDRPITFNGSGGEWTLQDAMTVGATRAFNITTGTLVLAGSNLTAAGAFTLGASGTLKLQGGETVSTIDTVTASSTVIYNGTTTYLTALAAGNTYSNLTFAGVGGVWEPDGAVTVGSNLTITDGTFDVDGQNLTVTGTLSNDSDGDADGTLRLTGGETTFSFGTFDTDSGIIEYDGGGSYTGLKGGNSYNDLVFNGAGSWTLGAALDVNDDITLTAGTLDVSGTNYGITVGGDWTDSGAGVFTEQGGTVTFDGTGTVNANETFNSVTINSGGTITLGAALDLADTLTLTAGTFTVSGTNYNITAKSWTDTGAGTFTEGTGTVTFDVAGGTINSNETFENVTINHAGTTTLGAALDLDDTLTISGGALDVSGTNYGITAKSWTDTGAGTFTEGSGTVTFDIAAGTINSNETFENVTINHAGTTTLGAALDLDDTLTISGGALDVSGTNYGITLKSWTDTGAGTFTEGSGTVTFDIAAGTINSNETFENVTINHAGTTTLGAALDLDDTLTISGGALDVSGTNYGITAKSWTDTGSGTFTEGSGTVTFDVAGGTINSNDTFNSVTINHAGTSTLGGDMTVSGVLTITSGTLDASSYTITLAGTNGTPFSNSGTFTASTSTVTYTGNNSGGDTTIANVTYNNLTVNNSSETYVLSAALDVNDTITITTGVLSVSGSNYGITAKSWTDTGAGTFTEGTGTVTFDVAGGTINSNETFENVTINHAGTTTLGATLDLDDTLTITAGTLDVSSSNYGITAKSWTDTGAGTFTEGTGTVTFDVAGGTINANETFNHLTINHAGTSTLGADLTVANNLTITSGTLDVSAAGCSSASCAMTVGGNWSNSGTFTARTGTVTLNGTGQKVFGSTTFYTFTKDISSGSSDTLMFENSKTQTGASSGTFSLIGASGKILTLRSMDSSGTQSDGTQWDLVINGSQSVTYVDVKDSDASGGTQVAQTNSTNSGNNLNWAFSSASSESSASGGTSSGGSVAATYPRGPFSFLINGGSAYTNQPIATLTISSSPDTIKMEISNTPNFAGSLQENFTSTKVWNLPNGDGQKTVYIRFYSPHGTPSPAISSSIILDTLPPAITASVKDSYTTNEEVVISGKTESGAQITLSIDNQAGLFNADLQGNWTITLGKLLEGSHHLELIAKDLAGNTGKATGADFSVIKGELIQAPSDKFSLTPPWGPVVRELADDIISLLPKFLQPIAKYPQEPLPVVTVPKEAPLALQGEWDYLFGEEARSFVFAPLPESTQHLIAKLPELEKTFNETGITTINSTVQKLQGVELTVPGIGKRTSVGQQLDTPQIPGVQFALPKNIPLVKLPSNVKNSLPSEVVFARTADELIDFNILISLNSKGALEQRIDTVSGKELKLAVKPDGPVNSVKGYLVLKSKELPPSAFSMTLNYLTASLSFANPVLAAPVAEPIKMEAEFLLQEFDYQDPDGDGIYTASITSPVPEGEYEVITVMNYKDIKIGDKAIRLIIVVDPEGYVYSNVMGGQLRIKDAVVSLYWLNPETKGYELWPAAQYQQENPQTTDETGKYSFLVPDNNYYLTVTAPKYTQFTSGIFTVKTGNGVHMNIELRSDNPWLMYFDWKTVLLVLILILVVYIIIRGKFFKK